MEEVEKNLNNINGSPSEAEPGYWVFNGEKRAFMLDELCTKYFNIKRNGVWIPETVLLDHITIKNVERFYRVMDSKDTGSIIFEDVQITSGLYCNYRFVINGSVLSRFDDGRVKYAVGYITTIQSADAEFISREIAGDGFFSWDGLENILHFSSLALELLGYDYNEYEINLNEWIEHIIHPDDIDIIDVEKHIMQSASYGDSFEFCARLRNHSGNYIWAIVRGIVSERDETGIALKVIGTVSDISLVQDNFENIKSLLYTDTLTGLKNRSYYQHHMNMWSEPRLHPVSVIYIDVTGLKITNDVLGHSDGDALLLGITDILTTKIQRQCDIMRLAGDEFLVIMPKCEKEECLMIMQCLLDGIVEHNKDKDIMPIFAGFGCAFLGEIPNDTLHACIERADERMQEYKDAHRKENYTELKAYLEKRMGRPVSMRDGRRFEYLSDDERKQAQTSDPHQ